MRSHAGARVIHGDTVFRPRATDRARESSRAGIRGISAESARPGFASRPAHNVARAKLFPSQISAGAYGNACGGKRAHIPRGGIRLSRGVISRATRLSTTAPTGRINLSLSLSLGALVSPAARISKRTHPGDRPREIKRAGLPGTKYHIKMPLNYPQDQ